MAAFSLDDEDARVTLRTNRMIVSCRTYIHGLPSLVHPSVVLYEVRRRCGCGAWFWQGRTIVMQGDHRHAVKQCLVDAFGIPAARIDIQP